MKTATWLGILIGLGALALLLAWQGAEPVLVHLGKADWAILLIVVFGLPELLFSALSWRCLFLPGRAPAFRDQTLGQWMGTAVNALLPVATIGGEVVKARYVMQRGVPGTNAVASVFLDKTVQAISILAWTLVGLAFLLLHEPPDHIVVGVLLGALLLTIGIAGFIVVQQSKPFEALTGRLLARRSGERWRGLVQDAAGLDQAVRALYARRRSLALASALRLCARVILAGEIWFAAWLMGIPLSFEEAVILKSLSMALRAAGFVIPAGVGLQEGAFIGLGLLLGLPADAMLTLSLASRLREILFSLPGLLVWQIAEGRTILARRASP